MQMLRHLNTAFVYPDAENWETNRKLWDEYAKEWSQSSSWVRKMASDVGTGVEDLACIGEEWSDRKSLDEVMAAFVTPNLHDSKLVAEIGSGGGRMALRVAPHVKTLKCYDISMEMLKRAKAAVDTAGIQNVTFCLLKQPQLPASHSDAYDFIYCFDVMVHMDIHTIWRYLTGIHNLLRSGGMAFVSAANLLSRRGWARFSRQKKYSVGGFYFISPDIFRFLVDKANFEIVKDSVADTARKEGTEGNVYFDRDMLLLLRKKLEK
eukprot:g1209.t1